MGWSKSSAKMNIYSRKKKNKQKWKSVSDQSMFTGKPQGTGKNWKQDYQEKKENNEDESSQEQNSFARKQKKNQGNW